MNKMIDAIDAIHVKGNFVGGVVTYIAKNVSKVCFWGHLLNLLSSMVSFLV